MLEQISIENIGVIRRAQVRFDSGLTAITGETGAGKTMLLTGLGLLMGAKADRGIIREGQDRAVVEGNWLLALPGAPTHARDDVAIAIVEDAGGTWDDDGSVIAARVITANRARAHLGGRTVPGSVLAEFANELVTVHGQSDQLRLRTPRAQREALDKFLGPEHQGTLAEFGDLWRARSFAEDELNKLVTSRLDRLAEAAALRDGLNQVEAVSPQAGEDEALAVQISRLANVEELRVAAGEAHAALAGAAYDSGGSGELGAAALVGQAERALTASSHGLAADPVLVELAAKLTGIGYELSDIATELASYLATLAADPQALEAAQRRRADLVSLTRAVQALPQPGGITPNLTSEPPSRAGGHRGRIEADSTYVLAWADAASRRLLELADDDGTIDQLTATIAELTGQIDGVAAQLTANRQAGAQVLAEAVTRELHGLAMSGARLIVQVNPAEIGPHGCDEVTFALVPHLGAASRPLAKGASGGELSRVMLALEVSLAADDLPTFVFDEVDAGVGGAAAREVGRRLAQLAKLTQVIVVTHMPQVAAFADQHLVVTKTTSAGQTETDVHGVAGEERVQEIARMLSGKAASPSALEHARELIAEAATAIPHAETPGTARPAVTYPTQTPIGW